MEAAIAATVCTGLYHAHSAGIGGGFFMVAYSHEHKNATSIDAREVAPTAAKEMMFVDNKNISSVLGWHAAAVPGDFSLCQEA